MLKKLHSLPFVFFIVSGACGLVYEVAWARYLGLFLGNTTLAHMCVLAAFMGGLAAGSFALGAAAWKFKRPLAAYGWLEILIGLYAVAFPFLIQRVQTATFSALSGAEFGGATWLVSKLGVSALTLLLPTFLMGGTFPILMRHFQPSSSGEDKAEWLYLTNCSGAVVGALLAGFVFIPSFGLSATLRDVGLANTLLGAAAVALAFAWTTERSAQTEMEMEEPQAPNPIARPVYVAIAVSGMAAMVYELVWIRIFAVTLGSSTYSFTLMVAAFITGLALGSLALGLIPRLREKPLLAFALSEIAIGVTIIVSIPLYEKLPYTFWQASSLLRQSPESMWLHNALKYSLCFAAMAIPTIFFGMTLPLAIKAVARPGRHIGKDSGFIYGANTAGTLFGAALTGLVFIPLMGLRHSLELAILANMATGVLLLWCSDARRFRALLTFGAIAASVLLFTTPQWRPAGFSRGTFRERGAAPASWTEYQQVVSLLKVCYYREDGGSNVAVLATDATRNRAAEKTLFIDGKADGSAYGDMPTQILLSHLPLLFKPEAKDVLMVGLGTGASAGSALCYPDTHVDCVEISPAVVESARHFSEYNKSVLDNPRMTLIVEDARTLVAITKKKYDVIVSEPSNPWVAGMGNLFSLEYFKSTDRVLKPGGVIVQWFHTYEMSDELVSVIVRTMREVFPCVYVFHGSSDDYIALGSRAPLEPDFARMEQRMRAPSVRRDLDRISVDSVAALLGLQALSPANVARLAGRGPINSDDLPVLEYRAPLAQYINAKASQWKGSDERLWGGRDLFSVQYLAGRPLDKTTSRSMIRAYTDPRIWRTNLALALLDNHTSRWPDDAWAANKRLALTPGAETPRELMTAFAPTSDWRLVERLADHEVAARLRAYSAFTPQDFSPAMKLLDRAIALNPTEDRLKYKREQLLRMMP
ncbi:MAG: fused MFS/spermidine synthase [Armatimonadota bacterium]|nr:fused MFS/spermidine synthase [Armatimonadota bacterium]